MKNYLLSNYLSRKALNLISNFYFDIKLNNIYSNSGNSIAVILIDYKRFRGDLQSLINHGNIDIYTIENSVIDRINHLSNITGNNLIWKSIINKVNNKHNIDFLMSTAPYYLRNILIEKACLNSSIKFVCYFREGVGADPSVLKLMISNRIGEWRNYYGQSILFGNKIIRDIFLSNKYIDKDIDNSVCGVCRVDATCIESKPFLQNNKQNNKQITFFSFPMFSGIDSRQVSYFSKDKSLNNFNDLFISVHSLIIELANKYPNYKFVIKPKWYGGEWKKHIDNKPTNLVILDNVNVEKLIKSSDLVVAFNSTTIIESAIQLKPVIIPIFDEAINKYSDYVYWKNRDDIFYIANSREEFVSLIDTHIESNGLKNKMIDMNTLSDTIGYCDGGNTERLYKHLLSLKNERQ